MLDGLKVYGWMIAAIVAGALLTVQTLRLHSAQLDAATTRTQHAELLAGIATKTQVVADAVRRYEHQVRGALAAADQKHTEELKDAKAETKRLRECVRDRTCGVRIVTVAADQPGGDGATDTDPGGVGDAAGTLNAGVAEGVLDLRDAIAEDSAALSYLQDYAQQCYDANSNNF